jgi:hypothetical protein
MAVVTACLVVAGYCAWRVWSPGFNENRFSPIYADGAPVGLMKQIEEREQVTAWSEGLASFRDTIQANNNANRVTDLAHPLISDRPGIRREDEGVDTLRRQWDQMCQTIRARLYERRIGAIDSNAAAWRMQRQRATDAAERTRIDAELEALRVQRAAEVERRRTNADPALSCTPAAVAPACARDDSSPWCNPQLADPDQFPAKER